MKNVSLQGQVWRVNEHHLGTYRFAYVQGAGELVHLVIGIVALQCWFLVSVVRE